MAAIICYVLKGKCDRMAGSVNAVSESRHSVTFPLQNKADNGRQLVSPSTRFTALFLSLLGGKGGLEGDGGLG